MLKLRHILLSNKVYYLALIIAVLLTFIRINSTRISTISSNTTYLEGTVVKTTYNGDLLKITLKINSNENIDAYYYFKNQESLIKTRKKVKLGCKLGLQGILQKPTINRVANTFNYPRYLQIKKVNYLFQAEKLTLISYSKSPLYRLKNQIYTYINTFKAKSYIKMILLGDSDDVSKEVIESFRANGISHLFAISGTQVTVLAETILIFLTKVKVSEKKRYIIVNIFTLLYLYLTGSPPAVLRAVVFFLLSSINKYNYFYITSFNLFILTLIITLLINPFYIYDLGFLYSYIISAALIICSKTLNGKSKFKQLILTSIISFLISMPITLYTFYEVNIMSILYNLFYVPFVNNILFPLAILVLFFPFLDPVLMFSFISLKKPHYLLLI